MIGNAVSKYFQLGSMNIELKYSGWCIRERIVNNKPISFELGCYLEKSNDKEIFISIPVHASLKKDFIKDTSSSSIIDGNGYNYYLVPNDYQFAISTYKNKKNNICNMLVKATEENKAVFISCFAVDALYGNKILNVEITTPETMVLKKYIDKDRRYIGLITLDTRKELINPYINLTITSGVIDAKTCEVKKYEINTAGINTDSDIVTNEEGNKTQFINLKDYIELVKPINNDK